MEMLLAVAPWLAILACPLVMLATMRLMPGGSCHQKGANTEGNGTTDDQIRQLKARVAELEAQTQTAEVTR